MSPAQVIFKFLFVGSITIIALLA